MFKSLIIIRFKQLIRSLIGIGLLYILFLIGIISLICFYLFILTDNTDNSYYVLLGLSVLLFGIHLSRKDKLFLKLNFKYYQFIYFTEYCILSIPVVVCFLLNMQWIPFVFLMLFNYLVGYFNFPQQKKSLNTKLQKKIPLKCFEWKSGVRIFFYFLIPIWILAFSTSFITISVPLGLLIIGICIFSFNYECEPYQMVLAFEKSPKEFLTLKIKNQVSILFKVMIPLIIAFLLFHFQYWYIVAIEFIFFNSFLIYFILTKYAFYRPNEVTSGAKSFFSIGTLILLIFPPFIPLIWILSIRFYFKSLKNLNYYLNDYIK